MRVGGGGGANSGKRVEGVKKENSPMLGAKKPHGRRLGGFDVSGSPRNPVG